MGGSYYSRDDAAARSALRSSTAKAKGIDVKAATFAYDHAIKTGTAKAAVHATLNPKRAVRESRDSAEHPVTVPVAIILDTTGSMQKVPVIIQEKLSRLMGCFLEDKASGKRYLGDGYPAILIGAVDDYDAMRGYGSGSEGSLQIGQFESGLEVDDNLTNLWMTGNGGGTFSESYELAMYFVARHTVTDHWEKRGRKGYCFIIGDEHAYPQVSREQVSDVIGDILQSDIPTKTMIDELREKWNVFFILPNMTSHFGSAELEQYWKELLGQNFLKLQEPGKICECIVGAVAAWESDANADDLASDLGLDPNLTKALVPVGGAIARHSAAGLPATGSGSGVERL